MTPSERKKSPAFFEEHDIDPVATAGGLHPVAKTVPKKKAGFYISEALLERFNRRFHQMKMEGQAIENKSALLELALTFALDDLDQGTDSILASKIKSSRR